MIRTLKVLGFLLSYPSNYNEKILEECWSILQNEKYLSSQTIKKLHHLITWMAEEDTLEVQESYVALFDRTPSLCLHFFEHIHGDSRDRGQSLWDLMNTYQEAGLLITTEEMPDYLPLFLEYLSTSSPEEARTSLHNIIEILVALEKRLENRQSAYAAVFSALVEFSQSIPKHNVVDDILKKSKGDVCSLDEIDKQWEEQFAFDQSLTFDQRAKGCPISQNSLRRLKDITRDLS